jgi:hypothetical protein
MTENQTRLDDAIERAVRNIMRRDPPPGLRARVLSRLDAPTRTTFAWPQLATAAVAVAAVAIALVMLRDAQPVPSAPAGATQTVAAGQSAQAPPPITETPPGAGTPAGPRPRAAPRREPVRTVTFGPRDGRIAAANLRTAPARVSDPPGEPTADDAPVPLPPAVFVDALTPPRPIEIAPIVVVPIEIPRIRLVPASPPQ